MNKTLSVILVGVASFVVVALIFVGGFFLGRSNFGLTGNGFSPMMQYANRTNPGFSMMNGFAPTTGGYGMMGGYFSGENVTPISVEQARQAVENYLKSLNNTDLEIKEIMIFDNNGYARITEKSTGIGAMELLIDPSSLSVYPEYGPNMMWNLKYSSMGNMGSMMGGTGGMMGNAFAAPSNISAVMSVSSDQAVKIAQQYLDKQFPGYQADTNPDPFYGYYTLDILKDGKPIGMLSVNGYTGQVFLHTWHGTFLEMWE
jgi:hypothetical protein